jgi:DNA-binding beta-propeller fold protein YncE
MNVLKFTAACSITCLALTGAASAETAVGLVGDKTLVLIDTAKGKVTKTVEVSGVSKLHGIDLRPANKMLYGVATDGAIVTIDPETGKAAAVSKLEKNIAEGTGAIVDFNPAADKLRFMSTDGTNLRADVESGKVTTDGSLIFLKEDMHAGEKPNIPAAAYINSYGKPEKTAMYDIDATIAALIQQVSPNEGTLKAIGKLGISPAKAYAFDVATTADGKNTAWLVADNALYSVDLMTGKATASGKVEGASGMIRDIAVLPKM